MRCKLDGQTAYEIKIMNPIIHHVAIIIINVCHDILKIGNGLFVPRECIGYRIKYLIVNKLVN